MGTEIKRDPSFFVNNKLGTRYRVDVLVTYKDGIRNGADLVLEDGRHLNPTGKGQYQAQVDGEEFTSPDPKAP